jgi:flagellar basal-body rod protein FlgC
MKATEISLSALDVEWRRLEIIAQNLANASSTRAVDGSVYRSRYLVSGPKADFRALLETGNAGKNVAAQSLQGVEVYSIETDDRIPRFVYDPENPQANADGMVPLPDVDEAGQMTQMIRTARVYEANLVALNIARQMYGKALELGKNG